MSSANPIVVVIDDDADSYLALKVAIASRHDDVIVISGKDVRNKMDLVCPTAPIKMWSDKKPKGKNKSDRKRDRANRWR